MIGEFADESKARDARTSARVARCAGVAALAFLLAGLAVSGGVTAVNAQDADGPANAENKAANDAATNRAAFGKNLGVQAAGNGQFTIRWPMRQPIAVPTSTGGDGLFDAAREAVRADPARFAHVDADQLVPRRLHPIPLTTADDPGMWWTVEFDQVIEGRPVEDGLLQFGIVDRVRNRTCEIVLAIGRVFPHAKALVPAKLSRDDAWMRVREVAGMTVRDAAITGERQTARIVKGDAMPVRHFELGVLGRDFVVNEATGDVAVESMIVDVDTVTVQGTVNTINHDPATQTANVPMPNVKVDHGGGVVYTDASGVAQIPNGASASIKLIGRHSHIVRMDGAAQQSQDITGSATVNFADTSEFPYAENHAYYHVNVVYQYLQTRVDTAVSNSFFDTFTMETQVNFNSSGNANFSSSGGTLNGGSQPRLRFFRADATYRSTAMSDVIYHEYGHYVDWAMGGLFSAGGLSEAWGDIVACFLHGDPEMAEGFRQNDDPATGNGIRNVQNNYHWNANDEIHLAGTAFGGYAWDIRSGFLAAQAGANWNHAQTPIERAETIVYAALDGNATSIPDAVLFIYIFDLTNGGDAVTKGVIEQAAQNHGLESYLPSGLRIEEMTCDRGFFTTGAAAGTANVAVKVQNLDSQARVIDVNFDLDGTNVGSVSSTSLAVGASETVNFALDLTAVTPGAHTLTATASSSGLAETDTRSVGVAGMATTGTIGFFDDFESGTSKWALNSPWALEAKNAHSPTMALSDSPGGDYANDAEVSATSIAFSLRGVTNTTVSLWQTAEIEADFDNGTIEMQAAGGPWMILGRTHGAVPHGHHAFDASYFDGRDNVKIRFRLKTDQGLRMDGWWIDDVYVFGDTDTGWTAQPEIDVVFEGFESGDFAGGTGWLAPWTVTGNATNSGSGPFAGTRHARLTGASAAASRGQIERFANIAGIAEARVQVMIVTDIDETDSLTVSVTDDNGASWTVWETLTIAHNGDPSTYKLMDAAVSDLGITASATFGIRISLDTCNGTGDIVYADNIRVYRPNHNPVLAAIGTQNATETQAFGPLNLSATDVDAGQSLSFSATNLPGWATLTDNGNGTATITGTPGLTDAGTTAVTITVSDNGPGPAVDFETFNLIVANTNQLPTIVLPGPQSATEGAPTTFSISASDPDLDTFTFSSPNLPAGATLNPTTGAFAWTPGYAADDASPYVVTFEVSDGNGGTDSGTVSITVADVNDPPVLGKAEPLKVTVGVTTTYTLEVADPDADAFTLTVTDLPPNATYDDGTRTFSMTPTKEQLGEIYAVTITANDGITGDTTLTLYVEVVAKGGCGIIPDSSAGNEATTVALWLGVLLAAIVVRRRRQLKKV